MMLADHLAHSCSLSTLQMQSKTPPTHKFRRCSLDRPLSAGRLGRDQVSIALSLQNVLNSEY
jgi:hypothetical protein